jgi:hypothetical protein
VLPIGWHLLMKRPPRWMRSWRWVETERGIHSASDLPAVGDLALEKRNEFRAPFSRGLDGLGGYTLLLAPLLGWAAYLTLMWSWTGNPLEGIQAQKHWGVHSITNLVNVPKCVIGLFNPTEWHAFTGSLLDRCMFILLLYTLPLQWRLGKDLLVWTYVLGVLPAMSGTFTSFTRFESTAFPMFIALAVFLNTECGVRSAEPPTGNAECGMRNAESTLRFRPSRLLAALRWGLLGAFIVLHLWLLWRFVNFRWAG